MFKTRICNLGDIFLYVGFHCLFHISITTWLGSLRILVVYPTSLSQLDIAKFPLLCDDFDDEPELLICDDNRGICLRV